MADTFRIGDRVRFIAAWPGLVPARRVGEFARVREVLCGFVCIEFQGTFHRRWLDEKQQAACLEAVDAK